MIKFEDIEDFISHFVDDITIETTRCDERLFLLDEDLQVHRLLGKEDPKFCGLFLGHMKRDAFVPSFGLLDVLAPLTEEMVVVNERGEMEFLYGRHLRKRHVVELSGYLSEGTLKIVINERGEVLGYGSLSDDTGTRVLVHLLDRGVFLKWDEGKASHR